MTPPRLYRNWHRRHPTGLLDREICPFCRWRREWGCDVRRGHNTERAEACVVTARHSPNASRDKQIARMRAYHQCPQLMHLLDMGCLEYSLNLPVRRTSQGHKSLLKDSRALHEMKRCRSTHQLNSPLMKACKSRFTAKVHRIPQQYRRPSNFHLKPSCPSPQVNFLIGHPHRRHRNNRPRYRSTTRSRELRNVPLHVQSRYLKTGRL